MTIQTINKSNWSGEEAKIQVNKSEQTVNLVDEGIKLQLTFETSPCGDFKTVTVKYEGEFLCSGGIVGKEWFLTDGFDCEREDSDPYVAAAQMAFNLI